jgi:ribosomal protein S18 acetylase RimI-like enzyme
MKTLYTIENIFILSYLPEYAPYFDRYNRDWLEEYFEVEPIDKYVLENPEEAILQHGGKILFAKHEGKIIGTVALKFVEPGVYELTKMAVDRKLRGHGAGKILCSAAIEEAKRLNAHTLILYSQTVLQNAIGIYKKMGFIELPLEPGVYKRADIKMGMKLK